MYFQISIKSFKPVYKTIKSIRIRVNTLFLAAGVLEEEEETPAAA